MLYRRRWTGTQAIANIDAQPDQSKSLESFLSCRFILLDKNPGVRPIGIGEVAEVLRQIAGKAIIFTINPLIMKSPGPGWVFNCVLDIPQPARLLHAMSEIFAEEETDAVYIASRCNQCVQLNQLGPSEFYDSSSNVVKPVIV